MQYSITFITALLGLTQAERIPLHYQPLTFSGLESQRLHYQMMANGAVPVKDVTNT